MEAAATEPLLSPISVDALTPKQKCMFRNAAQRWQQKLPFQPIDIKIEVRTPYLPKAFKRILEKNHSLPSHVLMLVHMKQANTSAMKDWFTQMSNYLSALPFSKMYTLIGYTYLGDAFSNAFLRNMFDSARFKKALMDWSLESHPGSYIRKNARNEEDFEYELPDQFFPLYIQAIQKLKKTPPKDWSSFFDIQERATGKDTLFARDGLDRYFYFGYHVAYFLSVEKFWKPVIQDFIQDLNSIIQASPALPCDIRLFRGIKTASYLRERRVCRVDGFLSTTASLEVANRFKDIKSGCCVQEITVSRGVHVVPIASKSHFPGEHEFLFGNNSILYISSMTDTKDVHKVALVQ